MKAQGKTLRNLIFLQSCNYRNDYASSRGNKEAKENGGSYGSPGKSESHRTEQKVLSGLACEGSELTGEA